MFKPITFDEQLVKSKNDGGLYNAVFVADGILWGCGITTAAASVTFASGEIVIGGRVIWIDGATTVQITNPIQNGYARIKARIDLTKKATQTEIEQFAAIVEFSTTTLFPELTKEDINNTGTIYEQELVVVKIDAGNVTAITRRMGNAIIDAEKLGGRLPEYYTAASATPRGYGSNNANNVADGWTVCNAGLPPGMQGWAYVLQTSFAATGTTGKAQIAISYVYAPAVMATRYCSNGTWGEWSEFANAKDLKGLGWATGRSKGGNLLAAPNYTTYQFWEPEISYVSDYIRWHGYVIKALKSCVVNVTFYVRTSMSSGNLHIALCKNNISNATMMAETYSGTQVQNSVSATVNLAAGETIIPVVASTVGWTCENAYLGAAAISPL